MRSVQVDHLVMPIVVCQFESDFPELFLNFEKGGDHRKGLDHCKLKVF